MNNIELLHRAIDRSCLTLGDLILAWKVCLLPERLAILTDLEAKGFRLGVHFVPLAGGRWTAQFTGADARGGLHPFDVVEQQAPPLPILN